MTGDEKQMNLTADGRRVLKNVGGTVTRYLYEGWRVVEARDGSDVVLRQYVDGRGIDEHIQLKDYTTVGNPSYFYHCNSQGFVGALTDSAGAIVEYYEYLWLGGITILGPDGNPAVGGASSVGNEYGFQGRRHDPETGLVYFRHRYYDTASGRFISWDPLGLDANESLNLYGAFGQDGWNRNDPQGLRAEDSGPDLSDNFKSDWAGRAILQRYLSGGGDWNLKFDSDWSLYMKSNRLLSSQLDPIFIQDARKRIAEHPSGFGGGRFTKEMDVEIQNGESIVGYEYLHGGRLKISATYKVRPINNGCDYKVCYYAFFTWMDRIDPNPKYQTDIVKNRIAEAITLGMAEAYNINIKWSGQNCVVFKGEGPAIKHLEGYPFSNSDPSVTDPEPDNAPTRNARGDTVRR